MNPPYSINVLDQHEGFTAETKSGTLWRPKQILSKYSYIGILQSYDEKSFFQNNNNVTRAEYKVKGYRYPVIIWFDNETRNRIA